MQIRVPVKRVFRGIYALSNEKWFRESFLALKVQDNFDFFRVSGS